MRRLSLLFVVALLLPTMGFAQSPPRQQEKGQETKAQKMDVTGVWDTAIESARGTANITTSFKQDGEKLTGSIGLNGGVPLDGTITGAALKFSVTIGDSGQAEILTFTGKIEGDTISGVFSVGDMANGTWSAKRQKK